LVAVACGIDWARDHHDVAVVDQDGVVVASLRVDNSAAGLRQVLQVLAEHDSAGDLPIAIETSQGLLVAGLRAAGRRVFAINPLAVSRYRDRYRTSRGKSDAFDAMVLANILRTDAVAHRPLPADSVLVQSLRVLTRAQQDACWDQVTLTNRVRALLRQFFPAALAAFERGGRHRLDSPAARTILAAVPTPAAAAGLSVEELESLLRDAGRRRGIAAEALVLHELLRNEQMRQPEAVEQQAMGWQLRGLLRQLDALCTTLQELEHRVDETFTAHPDAKIVTSVPGLGVQLGARLLAEIGDDRNRFINARALRAFAGSAPVTRSSGKTTFVHARRAKNDRIAATGYVWALAAVRHDPQWNARYRARRDAGDRHVAALRRLFNLMLGKLHHCLTTDALYDPTKAFEQQIPATT
jgi:Transposase/Transposase IS116/IS110/IS902 family